MKRPFLVFTGIAAAVLVAGATWLVITLQKLTREEPSYPAAISYAEPAVSTPLASMRVTRIWADTEEVFATLQLAVPLENAVDLSLFQGFDPRMTCDQASRRHGAAAGKWLDPFYRVEACFYDKPDGRISLCRVPNSSGYGWNTVAYPKDCTFGRVFRDPRLLEQLRPWLPAYGDVAVNVTQQIATAGLTVYVTRTGCTRLILSGEGK